MLQPLTSSSRTLLRADGLRPFSLDDDGDNFVHVVAARVFELVHHVVVDVKLAKVATIKEAISILSREQMTLVLVEI